MELQEYIGEEGEFETKLNQVEKEYQDSTVETEEIEYWERATRMQPKKNKKVQSDVAARGKLGEVDLSEFLSKTVPLMEKQLDKATKAFQYYEVDWGADNHLNHAAFTFTGEGCVTCLEWNCKGSLLAVGYGELSHSGWCSHVSYLKVYHLSRNKQFQFEVQACLSSVCFHPLEPKLLLGGTYNGQVLAWDLDREETYLGGSTIDEYQHREAVRGLFWSKPLEGQPELFSVSSDGKVLEWEPKDLEFPIRGFLINKAKEGGLTLSVPDSTSAIVGTESGKVLKFTLPDLQKTPPPLEGAKWKPQAAAALSNLSLGYIQQVKTLAERYAKDLSLKEVDTRCIFACKPDLNRLYPSPATFSYEPHEAPVVQLGVNSFHKNLFATCSTDGTAKLYHLLNKKPLRILQPGAVLTGLAWSLSRPLVLALGGRNGSVYVYDFMQSFNNPVTEISPPGKASVVALAFNSLVRDYLAVAYDNGVTVVYQMSPVFSSSHPDEQRRLVSLLENE